jgi:hypothetical protein
MRVELVEDKGILILLSPELFTMNNPAHVRVGRSGEHVA